MGSHIPEGSSRSPALTATNSSAGVIHVTRSRSGFNMPLTRTPICEPHNLAVTTRQIEHMIDFSPEAGAPHTAVSDHEPRRKPFYRRQFSKLGHE
jgi:hypothetical protein